MYLLTSISVLIAASPVTYLVTRRYGKLGTALLMVVTALSVAMVTLAYFNSSANFYRESYSWLADGRISLTFFVDGLSYPIMVAISTLFAVTVLYAAGYVKKDLELFNSLMCLLLAGFSGVFISESLVLFYIFWEFMLIPSFIILCKWGYRGPEKAAFKYFMFAHAGALLILSALSLIVATAGWSGLDIFTLSNSITVMGATWPLILAFMTMGFLIKTAAVPLHVWLPDAHGEAPAPLSALLSGAIVETGVYAVVRISLLSLGLSAIHNLADGFIWTLSILGVASIYLGGLAALWENDIKRIVAFSTISHMGYVLAGASAGIYALKIGAPPLALYGAFLHLVAHAWSKGLLFLVAGSVMHQARERDIRMMGGLARRMPFTFVAGMIAAFSIAGAPPFPCFLSEYMMIVGVGQLMGQSWGFLYLAIAMAFGTVVSAAYSLRLVWKVFWGTGKLQAKEADRWMIAAMLFLAVIVILLGVYPAPLLFPIVSAFKN